MIVTCYWVDETQQRVDETLDWHFCSSYLQNCQVSDMCPPQLNSFLPPCQRKKQSTNKTSRLYGSKQKRVEVSSLFWPMYNGFVDKPEKCLIGARLTRVAGADERRQVEDNSRGETQSPLRTPTASRLATTFTMCSFSDWYLLLLHSYNDELDDNDAETLLCCG